MIDGKDTIGAKALEVVHESMKRREAQTMSEPDTSSEAFRPNQDLQIVPEVQEGYEFSFAPIRWHPYKPKYIKDQLNAGQAVKLGRWQRMNEYAGWDNCETPSVVYSDHEMVPRSQLIALQARVDELSPKGAERYWEGRWRDEAARNEELEKALWEADEGLNYMHLYDEHKFDAKGDA